MFPMNFHNTEDSKFVFLFAMFLSKPGTKQLLPKYSYNEVFDPNLKPKIVAIIGFIIGEAIAI